MQLLARQLVYLGMCVLALQGCGNKGELVLKPEAVLTQELDEINQSLETPDSEEDDKKPARK